MSGAEGVNGAEDLEELEELEELEGDEALEALEKFAAAPTPVFATPEAVRHERALDVLRAELRSLRPATDAKGEETVSSLLDAWEDAALEADVLLAAAKGGNELDGALRSLLAGVLKAEEADKAIARAITRLQMMRRLAERVAEDGRNALALALRTAGMASRREGHHVIWPEEPAFRVEITDAAKVPARFWRTPEPKPDKVALLDALRRGPVDGAELAPGKWTVRIRAPRAAKGRLS